MRIEFNRTGAERKALVTAIAEILGTKPKYMGMPTASYDFGGLIVDKNGALEFEDNVFPKDIHDLLYQLAERGFTTADSEEKSLEEQFHAIMAEETASEPVSSVRTAESVEDALKEFGDFIGISETADSTGSAGSNSVPEDF